MQTRVHAALGRQVSTWVHEFKAGGLARWGVRFPIFHPSPELLWSPSSASVFSFHAP
jgi:hypothetical protein